MEKEALHYIQEYQSLWFEAGITDLKISPSLVNFSVQVQESANELPIDLPGLKVQAASCKSCELCEGRSSTVFGRGSENAKILFVTDGPGEEEEKEDKLLTAKAEELFLKILSAMQLQAQDVYLTGSVKCKIPGDKSPDRNQLQSCLPILKAEIAAIKPKMVVGLGLSAAQILLDTDKNLNLVRGQFHTLAWDPNTPLMISYHPKYLLKNPQAKAKAWDDMKQVMKRLHLKASLN